MIVGWWPEEIAKHLQIFYNDLVAGKRPKLVIAAPPLRQEFSRCGFHRMDCWSKS